MGGSGGFACTYQSGHLLSSISVIVPPTDSSYGNRDITADIAIHKNSNGWGPVARRAPLGRVIGQAAKGRESAEHVVLHPGPCDGIVPALRSYVQTGLAHVDQKFDGSSSRDRKDKLEIGLLAMQEIPVT
ncbi:hypothetical protein BTVI_54129 [Pitangus sulphuratus]|nr:hypothetical protein BTVI_54129 [Pitangus sulphuratus]